MPSLLAYQFDDTESKLADVSSGVTAVLTEGCPECESELTPNSVFACIDVSSNQVLYRAEISANPESDCTVLVNLISQWVTSGTASVSVLGNHLDVDPDCLLQIQSLSSPLSCTSVVATETPQGDSPKGGGFDTMLIVYIGVGGGGVALVVGVMVCVCCCVAVRRRKRKRMGEESKM